MPLGGDLWDICQLDVRFHVIVISLSNCVFFIQKHTECNTIRHLSIPLARMHRCILHVQTHMTEWLKHTIYPMHSTYSKCLIILHNIAILCVYIYMHTSIEREDRVLPCVLAYTHVVYACVLGYMHMNTHTHTQRQTCRPKGPTNKHSYQSFFQCRNPKIPLATVNLMKPSHVWREPPTKKEKQLYIKNSYRPRVDESCPWVSKQFGRQTSLGPLASSLCLDNVPPWKVCGNLWKKNM